MLIKSYTLNLFKSFPRETGVSGLFGNKPQSSFSGPHNRNGNYNHAKHGKERRNVKSSANYARSSIHGNRGKHRRGEKRKEHSKSAKYLFHDKLLRVKFKADAYYFGKIWSKSGFAEIVSEWRGERTRKRLPLRPYYVRRRGNPCSHATRRTVATFKRKD